MRMLILLFVLFLSIFSYSQSYQPYMTALGFPEAWNISTGNEDVIIAVFGNGIHSNHPALINSISSIPGYNFYGNNTNVTETRSGINYNHETSVAGILAAQQVTYNNYIVKGLAPGCKIMSVKFYEPDDANDPLLVQKLADSFNYIRDKQLQYPNKKFLINLSFGFRDSEISQTEKDLIANAIQNCYNIEIPVFCIAGNNSGEDVEFPANLTTTFAITALIGTNFNFVYSNAYSTGDELDLGAPEHVLYTTFNSGSYYNFGQTSGATPQACAIAALVLSIDPNLPIEELRRVLHKNTFIDIYNGDIQPPQLITYDEYGYNEKVGYGRVDALSSLAMYNFEFVNNVEGNTSIGQMTVEGETISSGDEYPFFRGEEVNMTAYDGTYPYNNYVNKFYNWNYWDYENQNTSDRDRINYFYSDKFMDDEIENTSAYFRKTKQLTIRNKLEGVADGGTILFGESTLQGDVINRVSPYTENAFINNPPQVVATYKAEANSSIEALLGTDWNFVKWENGSTNEIREEQVSQSTSPEWKAKYKGIQRSDDINGYSSNSQRKFVKTDDGDLHSVYESMGKVWYERSTDGGQTWEIIGGKPIDASYDSKQPSIDYLPLGTVQCIVIAYQRKFSDSISEVCFRIYDSGVFKYWYQLEQFNWDGSYSEVDATPVVSISKDNQVLFVWKSALPLPENPPAGHKIKFSFGQLVRDYGVTSYHYTPWSSQQKKEIPNTTISSKNISIAIDKGTNVMPFHLAYQEGTASIKYWFCTYNPSTPGSLSYGNPSTCSGNTGFTQHYSPSIISMGNTARVCWFGYRKVYCYEEGDEIVFCPQYRVLFRRPDQTTYWQFGNSVSSPNINKNTTNTYYAIAWSENQNSIKFADNTLSTVRTIAGVTGQQLQVSNGSDKNNMYCMAYEHNSGVPYYFERSNNLGTFYMPAKMNNIFFATGREGVISIDSSGFYFAIGDVEIDGEPVEFIEISDTAIINNQQSLNQYLMTEPINISDNSSFLYGVQYGITDSLAALQAITGDRFINFKVQLVDDNTGELIGEFDNVNYTANNLYLYNNISYQVNTQGIGNRTVRLKLVLDNNFEAEYSLSGIYSDEYVLNKTSVKQINYTGGEVVKSYELSQNYPNPFNPSTTIKFQIPTSGDAVLKIYDILGNEITTLVNEFLETGKYEVNFDATALASGVYIYRLNVNDFVNVKKMVLLK